jgi:hypothetical protein
MGAGASIHQVAKESCSMGVFVEAFQDPAGNPERYFRNDQGEADEKQSKPKSKIGQVSSPFEV